MPRENDLSSLELKRTLKKELPFMNQEIYISKTMTWELHLKIFCIGLLVITTLLCRLIYVSVWVGRPLPSPRVFFYPFPKTESLFKGYVF